MAKVIPYGWRELEVSGGAQREIETLALPARDLPDAYSEALRAPAVQPSSHCGQEGCTRGIVNSSHRNRHGAKRDG